jgi:hypothetical protein
MIVNLTVDNMFRHPLRWNKMPIYPSVYLKFGIIYQKRRNFGLRKIDKKDIHTIGFFFFSWQYFIEYYL